MPRIRMEARLGGIRFATGTYTGDGGATQAITGIGFQPRFVVIYTHTDSDTHRFGNKNDQDGTKAKLFAHYSPSWNWDDDCIVSLDADGFTVGDGTGSGLANPFTVNGMDYTWIAWS